MLNEGEVNPQMRTQFQQIIGSLLYIMLGTRPDIAFAVTKLAQFAANLSKEHLDKAKYVLHYLAGTAKYMLVYQGASNKGLIAYSDSDYATDPVKCRSMTGYLLKLAKLSAGNLERRKLLCYLPQKLNIWLCPIAANNVFGLKTSSLNLASLLSPLRFVQIMKVTSLLPLIQYRNDTPNISMCNSTMCVT